MNHNYIYFKIKNKIKHNEEIGRQQYELLEKEIKKSSNQIENRLEQASSSNRAEIVTVLNESRNNLETLSENYNKLHSDLQQYQQIDMKIIEQKINSFTENIDQFATKRDVEQVHLPKVLSDNPLLRKFLVYELWPRSSKIN